MGVITVIVIVVVYNVIVNVLGICLQFFDAVGWAAGRASACKTEW